MSVQELRKPIADLNFGDMVAIERASGKRDLPCRGHSAELGNRVANMGSTKSASKDLFDADGFIGLCAIPRT